MADQNILIKFGADTQEAVQDVNQLTKAIDGTDQATVDLNKSTQSLRAQLRGMQQDLAKMAVAGQQNTEQYKKLRNEAGLLQDAISDARREISNAGSDTRGLDKALRATTVLVGGFTALQGATALFGKQGEELQKTLIKINAAMSVLQGLQAIQNELTQKDSIFTAAAAKAKALYTAATTGAVTATKLFGLALKGLGIGLAIAAIAYLVTNFEKLTERIKKLNPEYRKLLETQQEIAAGDDARAKRIAALKLATQQEIDLLDERIRVLAAYGDRDKEIYELEKKKIELKLNLLKGLEQEAGRLTAVGQLERQKLLNDQKILDITYKQTGATKGYTDAVSGLQSKIDPKRLNQWNRAFQAQKEILGEGGESLAGRIKKLREEYEKLNKQVSGDGTGEARDETIEKEKEWIGYLTESLQFVSQLTSLIASARSARIQAEISDLERLRDEELKNADLTARQKEKIEERYQKQIAKLKTQQAIAQRRADITQAIINTSLAITQALGNPFRIALIAALGAAQIAVIARQPIPKFRKGGEITGNRHESGGVHIEAEGGEYMMRREAVDKYGKDFMKNINNLALPASVTAPQLSPNVINHINNKGIDHEKLAVTIGRELAKQPKVMIQMDEGGFQKSIQQGVKKTYYANRKFRAE